MPAARANSQRLGGGEVGLTGTKENPVLKFLGIVVAIIFIIGLLVVMGVFKLIF